MDALQRVASSKVGLHICQHGQQHPSTGNMQTEKLHSYLISSKSLSMLQARQDPHQHPSTVPKNVCVESSPVAYLQLHALETFKEL